MGENRASKVRNSIIKDWGLAATFGFAEFKLKGLFFFFFFFFFLVLQQVLTTLSSISLKMWEGNFFFIVSAIENEEEMTVSI